MENQKGYTDLNDKLISMKLSNYKKHLEKFSFKTTRITHNTCKEVKFD